MRPGICHILAVAGIAVATVLLFDVRVFALTVPYSPTVVETVTPTVDPALVEPTVVVPKENLTQPTVETKGRLEQVLDAQQLGQLGATNALRFAIRSAVNQGVPAATIVLLLSFPIVAMLVAAARNLLGIRGFGIFTPVVIAVAFVATGMTLGMTLFVGLLFLSTLWGYVTKRLRLQYLPRMALLILFMSIGILAAFVAAAQWPEAITLLGLSGFIKMNIFPLLVLILLTETFMSAQISHGMKQAAQMTVETLVLATVSAVLMSMQPLQVWILTHPELTLVSVALVDVLLGRFVGLRILEYWRFRELLKK